MTHPGVDIIQKAGGIHKFSKLNIPLMSDSGGFQVFSLASPKSRHHAGTKVGVAIRHFQADVRGEEQPLVIKISEDEVKFRSTYDGKLIEFTPELSMEYQRQIGADINMAFDECTYYPSTHKYTEKAMERTHGWLKRCIKQNQKSKIKDQKQYLYGVIQGGTYKDLRKKSAEFIAGQPVDGVAIGGVSVGETKKEMREQVKWVSDFLPKDKPVHLLGVGQFDDIIDLVKYRIDTFDCVEPTRKARMGALFKYQISNIKYQKEIDITRSAYKYNLEKVDTDCNCYVCTNFTKAYLHHLFKQKEILGYTLATYHNLWVMERFFDRIRELIVNNQI